MTNETWHRPPGPRVSPRVPKPGRRGRDCNDSKITDEEPSDNEESYDYRRLEDAFYLRSWPPSTRSGGDAGVHYEVWHRCKHVELLRGCFVQVIQQYLAVRQWHKPQASKTRRQAWMSTSCAELEPLEYVWSPLCSFVRKIKYRCAHGCYSMEIV